MVPAFAGPVNDLANALLPPKLRRYVDGDDRIVFDSKYEAASGILLERYLPGFRLSVGVSYQVELPGGKRVDFLDTERQLVLEYHYPVLKYECHKVPELRQLLAALKAHRRAYDAVQPEIENLVMSYYRRGRENIVRATLGLDWKAICFRDEFELYHLVLKPYGASVPSFSHVRREWGSLVA